MKNIMDAKIVAGSYVAKLEENKHCTCDKTSCFVYVISLFGYTVGITNSCKTVMQCEIDKELEALIKICQKELAKGTNYEITYKV